MKSSVSDVEESLIGTWTLVEWSEQLPDGSKTYPLGEDAIGQIVYTADGHVAAQLARRGRRAFPSPDWRRSDEKDAARAFKEYFGYFGEFSVQVDRQVVIHHIKGSWFPNLEGGDQERHYQLERGLLVLDANTDWGQVRIVWRKSGTNGAT